MRYYLLDNQNTNAPRRDNGKKGWYYPTRSLPILGVAVHITAGSQDLDTVDDGSAENTARYAATTDRPVSWHRGSDSDSWLALLPDNYTGFHVQGYNSPLLGLEISKRDISWGDEPSDWVTKTLRQAASAVRSWHVDYGIPLRRATKDELDDAIAHYKATKKVRPVGFVAHSDLDPSRRRDPGPDFPWTRWLPMIKKGKTVKGPVYMTDGRDVATGAGWSLGARDGCVTSSIDFAKEAYEAGAEIIAVGGPARRLLEKAGIPHRDASGADAKETYRKLGK